MEINLDLFTIADVLSIATAFMLGLLFLTSKSKNNKANIFLGLFLWSLTLEVIAAFLENSSDLGYDLIPTGALTIPLLFLYVVKTLNNKLNAFYFLLLIPFCLELTGVMWSYLEYVFNVFLLLSIFVIIKNHQKKVGDFYSEINNKTLLWIKNIIYLYLFFHLFWIVEDLIGLKYEYITYYFAQISTLLTLLMIYWIGYNGFSQPEIFNSILLFDTQPEIPENYSEKNTSKQFQDISRTIALEKLFLNPDLDLRILSKQLGMKEKDLSKLIKIHTQKNFYHFINQFRVEEFKKLLLTAKAQKMSLLGLSAEAGFNSKSTFYSAFKLIEKMTPKQYQNRIKKSE